MEPLIQKLGITREEAKALSINQKRFRDSGHPDSHKEYGDKHNDSHRDYSDHRYSEHNDRYGNNYAQHNDYAPGVN